MDSPGGALSFPAAKAKSVMQSVTLFTVLAKDSVGHALRGGASPLRLVAYNIPKCERYPVPSTLVSRGRPLVSLALLRGGGTQEILLEERADGTSGRLPERSGAS